MDQLKKILNPKIWLIIMALIHAVVGVIMQTDWNDCLLYTSPSPRDVEESRMPSSA